MIKNAPVRLPATPVVAEFPPLNFEGRESVSAPVRAQPAVVDALRFGMPELKSCAWAYVPQPVKDQMLTIAAADPASHELEALIRRVPDNTVLSCAWAESKGRADVRCWAISNFWPTVAGSEGVVLVFNHPLNEIRRVADAVIDKLLESLDIEGRPELVNAETILYVSKRDEPLRDRLVERGFETINAILP